MKSALTENQKRAAELYRDPDNSLSFICAATGITNKTVYAAIDALGIPRRSAGRDKRTRVRIALTRHQNAMRAAGKVRI